MKTFLVWLSEGARDNTTKQFYGSNFQYTLSQYIKTDDSGLAMYAVHFSEYNKWGVSPQTKYLPVGVYFYFLTEAEGRAQGQGFATDRAWANIARLNNDKLIILKSGHPRNFSEQDFRAAMIKLAAMPATKANLTKYGEAGKEHIEQRFKTTSEHNPWFAKLASVLYDMNAGAGWNRLLHDVGYDGIVDYDGIFLPIEGQQGVQTWPGGATYVTSIPTPTKDRSPRPEKRISIMMQRLKHQRPGTLKLTEEEFMKVMRAPPRLPHKWDRIEAKMDLFGLLLRAVDFTNRELWNSWYIQNRLEDLEHLFYDHLEVNPTTPKEFWERLVNSQDEGARLAARDMLKQHLN